MGFGSSMSVGRYSGHRSAGIGGRTGLAEGMEAAVYAEVLGYSRHEANVVEWKVSKCRRAGVLEERMASSYLEQNWDEWKAGRKLLSVTMRKSKVRVRVLSPSNVDPQNV